LRFDNFSLNEDDDDDVDDVGLLSDSLLYARKNMRLQSMLYQCQPRLPSVL